MGAADWWAVGYAHQFSAHVQSIAFSMRKIADELEAIRKALEGKEKESG